MPDIVIISTLDGGSVDHLIIIKTYNGFFQIWIELFLKVCQSRNPLIMISSSQATGMLKSETTFNLHHFFIWCIKFQLILVKVLHVLIFQLDP